MGLIGKGQIRVWGFGCSRLWKHAWPGPTSSGGSGESLHEGIGSTSVGAALSFLALNASSGKISVPSCIRRIAAQVFTPDPYREQSDEDLPFRPQTEAQVSVLAAIDQGFTAGANTRAALHRPGHLGIVTFYGSLSKNSTSVVVSLVPAELRLQSPFLINARGTSARHSCRCKDSRRTARRESREGERREGGREAGKRVLEGKDSGVETSTQEIFGDTLGGPPRRNQPFARLHPSLGAKESDHVPGGCVSCTESF